MKIEKWVEEQEKKYQLAIKDWTKRLNTAIEHENSEGVERATAALVKTQWYLDEILPVVREHLPKKSKKD